MISTRDDQTTEFVTAFDVNVGDLVLCSDGVWVEVGDVIHDVEAKFVKLFTRCDGGWFLNVPFTDKVERML